MEKDISCLLEKVCRGLKDFQKSEKWGDSQESETEMASVFSEKVLTDYSEYEDDEAPKTNTVTDFGFGQNKENKKSLKDFTALSLKAAFNKAIDEQYPKDEYKGLLGALRRVLDWSCNTAFSFVSAEEAPYLFSPKNRRNAAYNNELKRTIEKGKDSQDDESSEPMSPGQRFHPGRPYFIS